MTKRRVYIDANVWITAVQSEGAAAARALEILEAIDLQPIISDYVLLETLPKPQFHHRREQVEMFRQLFTLAEKIPLEQSAVMELAIRLAGLYDLTPVDALHASSALLGQVDEFITLEKPSKPFFKIPELSARSIYREESAP